MKKIQNILPSAPKSILRLTRQICQVGLMGIMCLTVTACHPDNDLTSSAIGFGYVGNVASEEQVTRATTPLENNLPEGKKNFRVWCYKTTGTGTDANGDVTYTEPQVIMDHYIVNWGEGTANSTATNTANWEYVGITNDISGDVQVAKYWDYKATSYRYFGFAPANADESNITYHSPQKHGDNFIWFDINFPADAEHPEQSPYISKLWFSNGDPSAYPTHLYGQQVIMEFIKPITKVRIRIVDAEGNFIADPSTLFSSLSFAPASGDANIVKAGKLKVSYAITGHATVANYLPQITIEGDPKPEEIVTINKVNEHYCDWYQVLPHVEQGDYQLIGKIGEDTKIGTVPSKFMAWHPNMEYTYIFKMTEQDFQFIDIVQIGVKEWEMRESEHDIYNW